MPNQVYLPAMPRDFVGHAIQIAQMRPNFIDEFNKARAAGNANQLAQDKIKLNQLIMKRFFANQEGVGTLAEPNVQYDPTTWQSELEKSRAALSGKEPEARKAVRPTGDMWSTQETPDAPKDEPPIDPKTGKPIVQNSDIYDPFSGEIIDLGMYG